MHMDFGINISETEFSNQYELFCIVDGVGIIVDNDDQIDLFEHDIMKGQLM